MFKKKRFKFSMCLMLVLSTFLAVSPVSAANTATFGEAEIINNINTFTDAGPDARGIRPGTFGSEYARLTKLSDGTWLCALTIYDNNGYAHMSSWGGTRLQVFKSTDNCRTWKLISTISDNNRDLDNAQIVQLPNGELRLAARSVRWQESYRIYIYKSTDGGVTWPYLSTLDANEGTAGSLGNPDKGIYEPHFQILNDGSLACFYANEKHVTENPSYSQIISEKISNDGGATWGKEIWVAWDNNSAGRPGMPVVTKMANGNYIVVFEVVGTQDANVFCKTSSDGKTWASGIGSQIPNQKAGPYITSLSDGRLMVTSCTNNLSFSLDYGASWYTNDEQPWTFGYNLDWSSVYQTGANEIAAVTSVPRTEGGHNVQIKFASILPLKAINSGKQYKLSSKCSNNTMCLDVSNGSTVAGANVQQWNDNGLDPQKWTIISTNDGYYKLINVQSGMALEVINAYTNDGANVQQWYDNGADCQKWRIEDLGNGYCKLVNKNSGKCLDVNANSATAGENVQQWTDNGYDAQCWKLVQLN